MKQEHNWRQLLKVALGTCCAIGLSTNIAHADVYQNVTAGQTLAQLAVQFRVSADDLRNANNLTHQDNAALPAMLLRIPDAPAAEAEAAKPTSQSVAYQQPAPARETHTRGSLTSSVEYTVRNGETWESIANFYAKQGYSLTAADLQQQNGSVSQLRPGTKLYVSLVTHYKPSSGDSASFGAVNYTSAEIIPQPKPLYQPQAPVVQRGPSNLASRGSYGLSGGGIQVLRGSENVVAPAPKSTSTNAKTTASVVKVKALGARIRRTPDPKGQVLFVCPVGTELAVTGHKGYWYSVLMSDRSTGWLPAKYVDVLQKQIDTQTEVVTGSEAAAMFANTGLQKVDGRYVSNNPFISSALTWMGTPYVYGGESRRGVDCSSLVQHVFSANGIRLPRTAAQQAKVGTSIATSDLQTGDRLYFSSSRTYIDHTGIYIGNGKFIHASGSRRGVVISDLSEKFYQKIYVGARR